MTSVAGGNGIQHLTICWTIAGTGWRGFAIRVSEYMIHFVGEVPAGGAGWCQISFFDGALRGVGFKEAKSEAKALLLLFWGVISHVQTYSLPTQCS